MLYDQTQAFFSGSVAVVARIGGALAAYMLAFSCYGVVFLDGESFLFSLLLAPLTALYMIGAWSQLFGPGALVALAAIIMTLFFAFRCVHTDDLRKTLGLLFASAFVLFFPIVPQSCDGIFDIKIAIWLVISGAVIALYFFSPKLLEILLLKLEEKINERGNRIRLKLLLRRVKRLFRVLTSQCREILQARGVSCRESREHTR